MMGFPSHTPLVLLAHFFTVTESAQCTATSENTCKAPANQENIFITEVVLKNLICSAFLYMVVLWAFGVRVLSNWRSCFLNMQVFFLFALHWALSATVLFVTQHFPLSLRRDDSPINTSQSLQEQLTKHTHTHTHTHTHSLNSHHSPKYNSLL